MFNIKFGFYFHAQSRHVSGERQLGSASGPADVLQISAHDPRYGPGR